MTPPSSTSTVPIAANAASGAPVWGSVSGAVSPAPRTIDVPSTLVPGGGAGAAGAGGDTTPPSPTETGGGVGAGVVTVTAEMTCTALTAGEGTASVAAAAGTHATSAQHAAASTTPSFTTVPPAPPAGAGTDGRVQRMLKSADKRADAAIGRVAQSRRVVAPAPFR